MKNINKIYRNLILGCFMAMASVGVQAQTCDYTTSSVTLNIGTAGVLPANSVTTYILVDKATGLISQITSTPTFTGFVQSKQYDAYALSYVNDGTVTGLTVGGAFSSIAGYCKDFSNPLTFRVCPATTTGPCDYTTSSFTVQNVTPAPVGATTQYFLTDTAGQILQIASTPTFSGLSGSQSYNVFAISYTGTVSNLAVGNNYNNITGTCMDLSNPLPVKVCVCQPMCLPVTVTKIK